MKNEIIYQKFIAKLKKEILLYKVKAFSIILYKLTHY